MDHDQVHYELFIRRKPGASWVLELASEDRGRVCDQANELFQTGGAIAAKVVKEVLDPETREFRSVTVLALGEQKIEKEAKPKKASEPLCVTPQDLYTAHAREKIGRLLEDWLVRQKATPFELLHRADLVEKLEASGTELQHAFQKIAVPESQDSGVSVHEAMRAYQSLVERAVDRLLKDHRKGVLPSLEKETFASVVRRVAGEAERGYLIGCGVAGYIAPATSWREKVDRLMDLADAAPAEPELRAAAFNVLETPLAELLGGKSSLGHLLGHDLDLGTTLAILTRVAGNAAVETLIKIEPSVRKIMPPLEGPVARLSAHLAGPNFEHARAAIAKRVLAELTGPRRLKPGDPEGEIATLRGLAMALTASAGRLLSLDDVQIAFSTRSRALVASDFVETLLGDDRSAREEAESLLRLAENVVGATAKRHAARWLGQCLTSLKFEKELRHGPDSPTARLAVLASLQRDLGRCGLAPEDMTLLTGKLGDVGAQIESDIGLIGMLGKAQAPAPDRLNLLLRMAMGELCPMGPAAERARAEVMRLLRAPDFRAALSKSPETLERLRGFLAAA